MMKTLLSAVLTLLAFSAVAQQPGQLEVHTMVQKEIVETDAAGQMSTRLVAAETVAPGDTVFYTITFTNIGAESAENVVITNPIAKSLSYVANSAFGPGTVITFSVDGGKSFADGAALKVTEKGGERAAEASDFTHVRWVMQNDLAVGAQGIARFAAVLN
jgi:uncharacterized repeat protein (TIGR01451 family)